VLDSCPIQEQPWRNAHATRLAQEAEGAAPKLLEGNTENCLARRLTHSKAGTSPILQMTGNIQKQKMLLTVCYCVEPHALFMQQNGLS
jgi:hypothetical protein